MNLAALLARGRSLVPPHRRAILGITGAPGAGKSTLAAALGDAWDGDAVLVPMDRFHLADGVPDRLGRRARKGAPDTFDAAGYVHLLRRLHDPGKDVVYAPQFRRNLELAEAGALPNPAQVRLVVTDGNYLLADGPFARGLLTECWYLEVPEPLRRVRLTARHVRHGRTQEEAERWASGSDQRNAELVRTTRSRADLLVRLE